MKHRVLLTVCSLGIIYATAAMGEEKKVDPATLFEKACSECHSTNDPKSQRNSRAEWERIVSKMRTNGCDISDKEAAIIVDYLTKEYGK